MGLVIEIKTIADQLVEFDLGRSVKTSLAATIPTAAGTRSTVTAISTAGTSATIPTTARGTSALTWGAASTFARGTIFAITLLCRLFFSHVFLILCQPGPFERNQAFRPQF